MTKSTITRERLQQIIRVIDGEAYDEEEIREWLSSDEIMELSRMALAAMDSEPVAIVEPSDYVTAAQLVGEESLRKAVRELYKGALRIGDKLYRHAQPASEREQVRSAHAEWSQATFGNVGPVGPLKHLSKEALEASAEPGDLSEWADMQFLLWDAQRRAGITDEQITQAMIEKLAVNKQRKWPAPKDGEPRLHIKEQPAPIASVCTCPSGDGSLRWPCPVHPGNSPVIPDGWTGNDKANAALMMLDRIETADPVDDDRIDGIKRIVRELAAAPHDTPALNSAQSVATVPGKWIPVSERMPEVGVKVLCFPAEDEPIHAVFNGQLWLQDVSWSGSEEPIDNVIPVTVTHWMPLPAGPQEVR